MSLMMRIISGDFKGRKLSKINQFVSVKSLRPTLDRVRESCFNSIVHNNLLNFEGIKTLDLFAGTGSNGLEALSRGSSFVTFIDKSTESLQIVKKNIHILGINKGTEILKMDATNLRKNYFDFSFGLVFMDPPYDENLGIKSLKSVINGNWIKKGTIIVWEKKENLEIPENFELKKSLIFKKMKIFILEYLKEF
tara:strand:- start:609 stop:1190 length:582 start_codon:yes stop_codon:yes gene_type:complete